MAYRCVRRDPWSDVRGEPIWVRPRHEGLHSLGVEADRPLSLARARPRIGRTGE